VTGHVSVGGSVVGDAGRQVDQTAAVAAFFDDCYRLYPRYWWREETRYSLDPEDHCHSPLTSLLIGSLADRPPGRALDLGAGEGADAIRLALLGYEVVAVEASEIGAEKLEGFARAQDVHVEVIHADATRVPLVGPFDVVVCNGLLHYVYDKCSLLTRIEQVTAPGGIHVVSSFTDATPVPKCHRVVEVLCDTENGVAAGHYGGWNQRAVWLERGKPDTSHPGFPPHVHSFIKFVAEKPDGDVPRPLCERCVSLRSSPTQGSPPQIRTTSESADGRSSSEAAGARSPGRRADMLRQSS
jgi:SAM-dependent methyltransferase